MVDAQVEQYDTDAPVVQYDTDAPFEQYDTYAPVEQYDTDAPVETSFDTKARTLNSLILYSANALKGLVDLKVPAFTDLISGKARALNTVSDMFSGITQGLKTHLVEALQKKPVIIKGIIDNSANSLNDLILKKARAIINLVKEPEDKSTPFPLESPGSVDITATAPSSVDITATASSSVDITATAPSLVEITKFDYKHWKTAPSSVDITATSPSSVHITVTSPSSAKTTYGLRTWY